MARDFEYSRIQRRCSEFSSPIGFIMGICISKVHRRLNKTLLELIQCVSSSRPAGG